jgi:hypothetical protein
VADDLLTEDEHRAVALLAELWNLLSGIVGPDDTRRGDLAELRPHIHAIQQAVLSQAAARAYPHRYRCLGEVLPPDGPWCLECVAPDEDPAPWCDCQPSETCGGRGPCRRRAHEPARCPTPGRW